MSRHASDYAALIGPTELTLWTFTQAGLPTLPDQPPSLSRRLAQYMGLMRYHWLRMPPGLLIRHLAVKSPRRYD